MKVAVTLVNDKLAHARGGEVVLYKRGDSTRWQARFKLKDLKWHRVATKHHNIQYAAQVACEAYDRARFLFEEKIPISSKRFDAVARLAIQEMEQLLASGNGKVVYNDYITVINNYLIPFFGNYHLNTIWTSHATVDKLKPQFEARSNASGLTPPKWLWRRVRL